VSPPQGRPAVAGTVPRMFRRAVRVIRLGGVDVRLDPSLVLLVALLVWVIDQRLALRFAAPTALLLAIVASLLLLASVLAHELGHALVARRRGIPVGGITLFALGGATELGGHGRTPREELVVAGTGPWISLVLAAGFGLIATAAERLPAGDVAAAVGLIAGLLGWLNLGLAAFNLLPAAPLDGGRVVHALLWRTLRDRHRATLITSALGIVLGIALIAIGLLLATRGTGAITGVATAGAGVFLAFGAESERRRSRRRATPPVAATDGDSGTDRSALRHSGPRPMSLLRSALASSGIAVVAVAALTVPMPFVEYRPGGATPLEPLIAIGGTSTTPLAGETALLTVRLTRPSAVQLIAGSLDRDRELLPLARVYPSGVDRQVHLARERERFDRQFDVAAAVGAAAAGIPFEVVTAVVVRDVDPDGPAAGLLAPGDVVLAVDGVPVTSGAALAELVRSSPAGVPLTLRIVHGGAERDQPVTPEVPSGGDAPRIGVVIQTAVDDLLLPIDIMLTPGVRIGGPSAGMMVGLTVYDLIAEEDLLRGRRVAGTGTLDVDGVVGAVGGVPEKALAAIDAGYDVLLVPAAETAAIQRLVDGRITVIGVTTLDEAIDRLRRRG
jgi:Lon-like protease